MIKDKVAAIAVTAALGLSVGLVGCSGTDTGTAGTAGDTETTTTETEKKTTDATTTEDAKGTEEKPDEKAEKKEEKGGKKDSLFSAAGYQGKLEDGMSFVYIEVGGDTVMVSLTDEQHEGDDAITYTGKAITDEAGKTTVTDEESNKSISFTITENADGGKSVDVEGHGKGELAGYEGNIFSVIGSMATDDAATEENTAK